MNTCFTQDRELHQNGVGALQAKGYAVTLMTAARPDASFLGDYPLVKTDALSLKPKPILKTEAYLDVAVQLYRYSHKRFGPYGPISQAQYRLVTVKGAKIALQCVAIHSSAGTASAYTFSCLGALNGDPTDLVAGLHSALAEVASAAVNGLP